MPRPLPTFFTRRTVAGFASGTLLGALTSSCLVAERLSLGDCRVAMAAQVLVTCAALLTLGVIERRGLQAEWAGRWVGAGFGIVLVHIALRLGWVGGTDWLVERPSQLVNDVVAVGGTLAVVQACVRGMNARILVGALGVVTVYRATGHLWHVDVPPQAFHLTVQQLVVAQIVALAMGVAAYEAVSRDAA